MSATRGRTQHQGGAVGVADPPSGTQTAGRPSPTPVSPTGHEAPPQQAGRLKMRRLRDLAAWSRQLLILVRSGMPLADAMAAMDIHYAASILERAKNLQDAMENSVAYLREIAVAFALKLERGYNA